MRREIVVHGETRIATRQKTVTRINLPEVVGHHGDKGVQANLADARQGTQRREKTTASIPLRYLSPFNPPQRRNALRAPSPLPFPLFLKLRVCNRAYDASRQNNDLDFNTFAFITRGHLFCRSRFRFCPS